MSKQLIRNLKVGDEVETQALILDVSRGTFNTPNRAGDYFWKLTLGDVSGSIKGIIWEARLVKENLARGDVVFLRGEVNDYHGPQVVISEIQKLDPAKVQRKFFQPVSERDPREMLEELKGVIAQEIKTPPLKLLLLSFFNDRQFVERFMEAPAARTIHHNYIGGLLEHTLEVISICRHLVSLYPGELQLDLLLTGAILHDIGKIEEYDPASLSFEFSDRGKLIGHISIGKEMLDQRLRQIPDFPESLKLELQHMILTHHGMREWGSPEIPKTIHAFALFHADLVSARLNQFVKVIQRHANGPGDWTDWDRFLERSIYLKRPGE
ncbi:MAG TPA: HD domain-containing protein [Bacillota bacterium]|jgi:3'-5' exoribonuclease|nr:HD domain-containing protein [Bacillota bacterium]HOB86085.1 HD domain-containing protein [Bacillota bacterium]HOP69013.1 HD domain-containing protein [Bacillota bacterium]HPT34072.1 HD domain-containing protein [Bacillota bacterium]HPZ65214.1 HD domain-containing protein [Bacillota bacterium]